MRSLLTLAVVVLAAPDRPDPTPKTSRPPHESLIGDWLYAGPGKVPMPQNGPPVYVFRFTAADSLWITNGKPDPGNGFSAKIAVDWSKDPVAIDWMPSQGTPKFHGILRITGDHLLVVWSHDGKRPMNFDSGPNTHSFTRIRK